MSHKYEPLHNIEFLEISGIILSEDHPTVDIVVTVGKASNFPTNEKIIGANMAVKSWKIFFYLFLIWNPIFHGETSKLQIIYNPLKCMSILYVTTACHLPNDH